MLIIVAKGKKAILVDTGKKEYLNTILEVCPNYEMELIVVTHGHFDHAENAKELSNKWKIDKKYESNCQYLAGVNPFV